MLVRMVYASTANESVTGELLESILKVARNRNEVRDLTGMLVFDHQHFLQVIEGDRAAVSLLLGKLMSDTRHKNLTVLELDEITQRSFADWSMEFVPAAAINKKVLLRNGISSHFDPHSLSKAGALHVLTELQAVRQSQAT
jgi:Sensors of blue-light using FAD